MVYKQNIFQSETTKFCPSCAFSASSCFSFLLLLMLLLVSFNCWTVRNYNQGIRSELKDRNEKNQEYLETIKQLEETKNEMKREIKMRDERTLELMKIKGELENKVSGIEKEKSKLKFDMEKVKKEIEQKNAKQIELLNGLIQLKDLFEKGRIEEDKYLNYIPKDVKSSELSKRLPQLRDQLRYNRNEVEDLLVGLSNML